MTLGATVSSRELGQLREWAHQAAFYAPIRVIGLIRGYISPLQFLLVLACLFLPCNVHAQGRGRGAAPPQTAKQAAPFDITGYWVSVITEDWHVRMLTPLKGDFGSGTNVEGLPFGGGGNIPYNAEGTRTGKAWDPAKDEAEGNQCKAYGAGGIMRQPDRLHITWEDDYTCSVK